MQLKKVLTKLSWHYLSRRIENQKIANNMNIIDVINRAVVIDNKKEEAESLVEALKAADILTDYIEIKEDENKTMIPVFKHPRELIFADLLLDENTANILTNISRIIELIKKIQSEECLFYGIVVWSKHSEHFDKFLKRIGRAFTLPSSTLAEGDDEEIDTSVKLSNLPLFVICMDKMKYLKDGEWHFDNLIDDINNILQSNNSAYFSLNWKKTVNDSMDNVINSIYSLSTDYEEHEEQISYLLKQLSLNETGEKNDNNLTLGSYQAFDSLLYSELSNLVRDETRPNLQNIHENPYGEDISTLQTISAMLNKRLFVEDSCLVRDEILPGNVYKVLYKNSPLIIDPNDFISIKLKNSQDNTFIESKEYPKINIAIELTPPCDSAQNKKRYSRLVGGYVFDMPMGKIPKKPFSQANEDKRIFIYPIMLPNEENEDIVKCIMFDFRYLYTPKDTEILDASLFELWFKAKPGLFADILQKFSSHASRLGINDIHLEK